ncbi:MAG: D-alanine--D-alanine ligase [Nitrospirae bacterium]|nr:D-alanine--D-alanine ligase [Nitrospirota bacterium]
MKIAVLMGGVSSEREVSLRSGMAILNSLKDAGYDAVPIDAGPDVAQSLLAINPGVALVALHGGWGENGSIQGLLEVLSIPYTGSGVLASAMAMDKFMSKVVFMQRGINVSPFVVLDADTHDVPVQSQKPVTVPRLMPWPKPWPMPWIVKPCAEGSSIGINVVRSDEQFGKAVAEAMSFGGKVLVEKFITGKEIQVGVLGGKVLGSVEIRPSGEFYDYKSKYTSGCTQYVLPPSADAASMERVEDMSLKAYAALGCKGVARVDVILSGEGDVYVLEVNTLPGMTGLSLVPMIAQRAGYSFLALIEEILLDAINGPSGTDCGQAGMTNSGRLSGERSAQDHAIINQTGINQAGICKVTTTV